MTTELAYLDASAQADLVRRGELEPAQLVDAAIARIERIPPDAERRHHPTIRQGARAGTRRGSQGPHCSSPGARQVDSV